MNTQTLPKMKKAAQSEELAAAFEKHHGETEGHVQRLEDLFHDTLKDVYFAEKKILTSVVNAEAQEETEVG